MGIGFGFFLPQEESGIEPLSSLPYIFLCYVAGELLHLCFSPTGTVLHSSSVSPPPNTIQSPLPSRNMFDCQSLSMDFFFLFSQASLILQHMLHNFPSCCFSFSFFQTSSFSSWIPYSALHRILICVCQPAVIHTGYNCLPKYGFHNKWY